MSDAAAWALIISYGCLVVAAVCIGFLAGMLAEGRMMAAERRYLREMRAWHETKAADSGGPERDRSWVTTERKPEEGSR